MKATLPRTHKPLNQNSFLELWACLKASKKTEQISSIDWAIWGRATLTISPGRTNYLPFKTSSQSNYTNQRQIWSGKYFIWTLLSSSEQTENFKSLRNTCSDDGITDSTATAHSYQRSLVVRVMCYLQPMWNEHSTAILFKAEQKGN